MIFVGSRLRVIDNSGAKIVECIKVLGGANVKAKPGSLLVVAVKKVNPLKKIRKGEIYRAVLVGTKKPSLRVNGIQVMFSDNYAVIVNNKGIPLGTRVLAPVMLDLRSNGFLKVISMSTLSI